MKKNNFFVIFSFLIALLVVSSGCIEEGGIHTTIGAGGGGIGGNITYNITYYGTMNQTPNMTAGPPGADGMMNQTPNMTAGNADMSWNASYYLRDNSRTLTGEKMRRDVDNDLFSLYGGNALAGGTGGIISLFGKDTVNPFSVEINVGDGAVANTRVTGWVGGATPRMDMNSYNISNVKDPVTAQDAATKNYVDSRPSGSADFTGVFFQNGTRAMTGDFDAATHRVTNLVSAIVGGDAVNKTYVDVENLDYLDAVAIDDFSFVKVFHNVTKQSYKALPSKFGSFVGDYGVWAGADGMVPIMTDVYGTMPMDAQPWISYTEIALKTDVPDVTQFLFINGTRAMIGSFDAGGYSINNLITGTLGTQATNKTYVDNVNLSMLQNVSANFPSTAFVNAVNNSQTANTSMYHAPLVSGKVPTVNLGGAGADATKYLRGDQSWQVVTAGSPTSATAMIAGSEFYDPTTGAIPGFLGAAISSGTVGAVATTGPHPGVIYMRDSTTSLGGYRYGCAGTQLIAGGESFEFIFQPVGVRVGQNAKIGWADTAAALTNPVDGVYFNISGTGAAITLRGNTSSNSARSGTKTTYTPTTATWYRGTIVVHPAANVVNFSLYNEAGTLLWIDNVTANIPTGAGRDTSPCIIVAESSTDAAANILLLDYAKWEIVRALVR